MDSTASSFRSWRCWVSGAPTVNSAWLSARLHTGWARAGITRSWSSTSSGCEGGVRCWAARSFTATQYRMVSSRRSHTSTSSRQKEAHTELSTDAYVDLPRSSAAADEKPRSCCCRSDGGVDAPRSRDRADERFRRSVTPSSKARNWRRRSDVSRWVPALELDQRKAHAW